ncbi:MAG: hypothetical protein NTW17_00040 [Candidatus Pacearchaeota archaeon]|nr:hypothetical protein [Candidatus Pacearchaeota archaeon]
MNPVYLKDWIKKIPVEKRILVSDVIFGFLILSVYLGIFGIIFSALFKSTTFFPFLYILIPLFLFLYIMFSPNLFERIIYDIKELSKNLNNGEEKRIFYHQLSRDLNKITRRKGEGYSKKFYTIFKDYFSNVMVYLIFSKRENSRKIIKEFLVKLSVSKDIYDLHDGFMEMNQKVIQLREFKNLLIAFPPLNKKELQNPFLWIPKISGYPIWSYFRLLWFIILG